MFIKIALKKYAPFICKTKNIFEIAFPLVRVSRKRSHDKPWITKELKESIIYNHKLYRKSLTGTIGDVTLYKRYNTLLRKRKYKAEVQYYNELFDNSKNSIYNLWKSLGHVINPNKKRSSHGINKLLINGNYLTDSSEIANAINEHFCSIGRKLQENIPLSDDKFYRKYLPPPLLNSFFLKPVDVNDVKTVIMKLNPKKSPGPDGINEKLL